MGWTTTPGQSLESLIRERTDRNTHRWIATDGTPMETQVLDHARRGNRLWKIVRYKRGNTEETYIGLDLLSYSRKDGAGYKDMSEGMGPYYYDCPLGFLDRVPEPEHPDWMLEAHARDGKTWRDKVRDHHAGKREARKSPAFIVGQRHLVVTGICGRDGQPLHWCKVLEVPKGRTTLIAEGSDGVRYRIAKRHLCPDPMGAKEVSAAELMPILFPA